jgi:hypothetical protein
LLIHVLFTTAAAVDARNATTGATSAGQFANVTEGPASAVSVIIPAILKTSNDSNEKVNVTSSTEANNNNGTLDSTKKSDRMLILDDEVDLLAKEFDVEGFPYQVRTQ